ncbi:MAG: iron ABC transporter permease [Candidatus Accumulibacter sp.]|jgi:iron complex transport system permease protein|nr:iron ABC transporter permease [Accumulibacter sp.]
MKSATLNAALFGVLAILAFLSLSVGPVTLPPGEIVLSLLPPWPDAAAPLDEAARARVIVIHIRLPRVALAVLVGASLGMSGAALQGLLRNPLADPGLIGVSASASLGAVLCIYFGGSALSVWATPLAGMACAALATLVLWRVMRGGAGDLTLMLAGIALSSLAAALTSLSLNLAPNPSDAEDIMLWLLGSVSDRSFDDLRLCLPFVLIGFVLLFSSGLGLEALTVGEDEARSLGVDLSRLRITVIAGAASCVGASVAVTGAIGFVGLVVPHMLRRFVGFHPARLLVSSALGGAALLLAADLALRLFSGNRELMLGVVTALIGAPFFLALVLREKRMAA